MNSSFSKASHKIVMACVLIGMLSFNTLSAQFNVKIGYAMARVSPEINNQILTKFNDQQAAGFDQYTPLPLLKYVNGVNLGLRYKVGGSSLEINWENLSRARSSVGITRPELPALPVSFRQEFEYSFNMFLLTFESQYESFGIGTSLGKNFVAMTQKTTGGDKFSFFNNEVDANQLFARFHLSLTFKGRGTVAFALKPYVQIPLGNINLTPIAEKLDVTNTDYQESYSMFGLSFNFYNGRQD